MLALEGPNANATICVLDSSYGIARIYNYATLPGGPFEMDDIVGVGDSAVALFSDMSGLHLLSAYADGGYAITGLYDSDFTSLPLSDCKPSQLASLGDSCLVSEVCVKTNFSPQRVTQVRWVAPDGSPEGPNFLGPEANNSITFSGTALAVDPTKLTGTPPDFLIVGQANQTNGFVELREGTFTPTYDFDAMTTRLDGLAVSPDGGTFVSLAQLTTGLEAHVYAWAPLQNITATVYGLTPVPGQFVPSLPSGASSGHHVAWAGPGAVFMVTSAGVFLWNP
jgi:hypothetical protein